MALYMTRSPVGVAIAARADQIVTQRQLLTTVAGKSNLAERHFGCFLDGLWEQSRTLERCSKAAANILGPHDTAWILT
jgi:hypothetical protein